jgi:hypothetical protein
MLSCKKKKKKKLVKLLHLVGGLVELKHKGMSSIQISKTKKFAYQSLHIAGIRE